MVSRIARWVLATFVVAAALGIGVSCATAAPVGGRLSGRVVDAVTDAPLAGCRVFLVAPDGGWGTAYVDTGIDGSYVFAGLPAGEYSAYYYMVSDPTHFTWTAYHDHEVLSPYDTVTIDDDTSDVSMLDQHVRPYCQLKGHVTLRAGGGPASAHVSAWKKNGSTWTAVNGADTDGSGDYTIPVDPGTYHLGITGAGLSPVVWPDHETTYVTADHVAAGQDVTVTLDGEVRSGLDQAMSTPGSISALVWANGSSDYLAGGTIYLYYDDKLTDGWMIWDSAPFGSTFSGLPVGDYKLYYFGQPGFYDDYYDAAFFASDAETVTISDGAALNIANQMFGPSHVSGRALSATSGVGVEGIHVSAEAWDGSAWVAEGSADTAADGGWSVDVPYGRYRFMFSASPSTGLLSSYYTAGGSAETSVAVSLETPLTGIDQALLPIDVAGPQTTAAYNHGWSTSNVAVSLDATDGPWGSGVASTWYKIGAADSAHSYTPGSTFYVIEEGTTTVYFGSVDRAGNHEADQQAVVRKDSTAPTVTPNVAYGSGYATVSFDCADACSGPLGVYCKIDGVGSETTYTAPIQLGVGTHTIQYYGMDQAENESNDTILNVTVAPVVAPRVGPNLGRPSLSPSKPKHGKKFTIAGRIGSADTNGGTVVLTIQRKSGKKWKKSTTVRATLGAGTLTYSAKTKIAKSGSYRVQASHAADAWHFAGTSVWRTFSVK